MSETLDDFPFKLGTQETHKNFTIIPFFLGNSRQSQFSKEKKISHKILKCVGSDDLWLTVRFCQCHILEMFVFLNLKEILGVK